MQSVFGCSKFCYDGPDETNPYAEKNFGGDDIDQSDPFSELENRNRKNNGQAAFPCVPRMRGTTSAFLDETVSVNSNLIEGDNQAATVEVLDNMTPSIVSAEEPPFSLGDETLSTNWLQNWIPSTRARRKRRLDLNRPT